MKREIDIEKWFEKKTNQLDDKFISGTMTQWEYNKASSALEREFENRMDKKRHLTMSEYAARC